MQATNLNERLSLDRMPIEIHADGSITDRPDVHSPLVYWEDVHPDGMWRKSTWHSGHERIPPTAPDGWEFIDGYSGQEGYSGPVMHHSEYVGGAMERDILAEPGVYTAVVVDCLTDDDYPDGVPEDVEIEPAGWAVLRRKETT